MHERSERLIQELGRRYLGVLVAVAAVLLLDQAVFQPALMRLGVYAPVINLAGRQRMLSQRLTKATLALSRADDSPEPWVAELRVSLDDWKRAQAGLQHGDEGLGLPGTRSPDIVSAFAEMDPHYAAMCAAVQSAIDDPRHAASSAAVLLSHEPDYLRLMDRTVLLFENEARAQALRLRVLGIAATGIALGLMAGLAVLVLRPAVSLIRGQVRQLAASEAGLRTARDELDQRVIERTRELLEANQALAHEVHERRRSDERSRQLQSELAHASRVTSLGRLATGLAHELNQPLGAITNYSEALAVQLETSPRNGDLQPTVRRIRDAALRAGRIVARMRNFVRPKPPVRVQLSVNDLVEDVLELCRVELRQAEVEVRFEPTSDDAGRILADPVQLQQVLVNLVQNATQAMSLCSRHDRRLTVRCREDEDQVHIIVTDTGPGFTAEQLLDERGTFQSTKADGLGMGLSISRSLLEAHQGQLTLENQPTGGARITISLPANTLARESHHADCLCRG